MSNMNTHTHTHLNYTYYQAHVSDNPVPSRHSVQPSVRRNCPQLFKSITAFQVN